MDAFKAVKRSGSCPSLSGTLSVMHVITFKDLSTYMYRRRTAFVCEMSCVLSLLTVSGDYLEVKRKT